MRPVLFASALILAALVCSPASADHCANGQCRVSARVVVNVHSDVAAKAPVRAFGGRVFGRLRGVLRCH